MRNGVLDGTVGVEDDLAASVVGQTDGQWRDQLAPAGFTQDAATQSGAQEVQFGFLSRGSDYADLGRGAVGGAGSRCRRGRHNRGFGLSMAFSVSREEKAMVKPCWARVFGPLAPYAAGLRPELERLGYTPLSAAGMFGWLRI
jgi:hypothetical protein